MRRPTTMTAERAKTRSNLRVRAPGVPVPTIPPPADLSAYNEIRWFAPLPSRA